MLRHFGALLIGGVTGFLVGVFVPIIPYPRNLMPLFAFLVTGPLGFVVGA